MNHDGIHQHGIHSWKSLPSLHDRNGNGDFATNTSVTATTTIESLNHKDERDEEIKEDVDNDDSQNKIRYRGRVAYDGTNFQGWQVQSRKGCRTIQGELESILSKRFNRTIKIVGAGRTDSGVHSRGQAFHFDALRSEVFTKKTLKDKSIMIASQESNIHDKELSQIHESHMPVSIEFCTQLQKSLNGMLKPDIRVYNISIAPPPIIKHFVQEAASSPTSIDNETEQLPSTFVRSYKWHVIYNAQSKLYSYRIFVPSSTHRAMEPIHRYNRVDVEQPINVTKLGIIMKHYEGTHDFRAFAGAIEANQRKDGIEHKDTVRTVYSITIVDEGKGNYRIDIFLKGALYKMVRNMVGTALDVCRERISEDHLLQLLHHDYSSSSAIESSTTIFSKSPTPTPNSPRNERDKKHQFVRKDNKCKPAHPEGLTLEMVFYDDF